MTIQKIALLAAIAMLAVPASASAAGTLDQNLRLESDGFDVASPNINNRNDFVDVIGDARYEERTDNPLAPVVPGVADRQRLRWSAHDLRFLKPTTVGTAPAAPDGTQFQTAIRQGTFNAITGALTFTSGFNIVRDAANNPILSTVEGQQADLDARFESKAGSGNTDKIQNLDGTDCNVVFVQDPATLFVQMGALLGNC